MSNPQQKKPAVTNSFDLDSEEVYVFPTTYPQQQIWFLCQLDPESAAYNIPFAYDVDGAFNITALTDSINEIIRRHEIFRTTYTESDDLPVQVVFPELFIEIPVITDLKDAGSIDKYIKNFSQKPFNLQLDPLIRAEMIKLDEQKHILLLNFHHIMLDHLSIVQFADELDTIYSAYCENKNSPLVEPDIHYADYAIWQTQYQNHDYFTEKLEFWKQSLSDKADYLDLPKDHPRKIDDNMQGAEYHLHFPSKLNDQLKQLSKQQSVSMFITMLAGFSIICQRYARQDEIAIGTPFANRSHQPELEKVMGCFINTLPLMADLSGDPSFNEVLKRLRKVVFGASGQQDMPFERIVEALQPKRDPGYNPVFQVGFTFQEAPMEINLPGCSLKSRYLHNETTKFDILAWLWDAEDGIHGLLEYNTALYEKETLQRFCHHYEQLLQQAAKQPDTPVSQLIITDKEEQLQLIQQWNKTEQIYDDQTETIHQCFMLQAQTHADKTAIIFEQKKLTYAELDQKSNQLAHYLLSRGLTGNALVGISLHRSEQMLIATLAVLKAAACYIPLDPEYPKDRLHYMLEDSQAEFLITDSNIATALSFPESLTTIFIDQDKQAIDKQSNESVNIEYSPQHLAYIIYTSGSTGKPKGVMISHQAACNFLHSMADKPGIAENDRLLAVTTLSFDIAVLELYLPLISGATTVIASREQSMDGDELEDLIDDHDITLMQATPATWRLLMSVNWKGNTQLKALCGGEALPADLQQSLVPKVKSLWNMYGPTETTVWSCCQLIEKSDSDILIGEPIANTQCYVVDDNQQLTPLGVPGELFIGGKGLARGYLNREELTQERFVPNPFSDDNDSRLYRTGDLVKRRSDGSLEYIQRIDNQIKLRGYRIELGEIQSVLSNLDSIKDSLVCLKEQRAGDPRLIAYIVLQDGQQLTATEIRDGLRQTLPDYMLPQHFVELDKIPLTPNGKIDNKALPSPFTSGTQDEDKTSPRNSAEQQLAEIWADALNMPVENIGVFDNFFDIGGHSLLSMSVISKIRDISGTKLNPRVMLLSSLEHIAPQCDFEEKINNEQASSNKEEKEQKKSSKKGFFKKIFRQN